MQGAGEGWAQPAASHTTWAGGLELPWTPHVRQAHEGSLPPWLCRWLAGLSRLVLNEVKQQDSLLVS